MSVMQSEDVAVSSRLLPEDAIGGRFRDLAEHQHVHRLLDATLSSRTPAETIALVEASGLTGRGGAGFPTARKLAAVAAGGASVVVANGAEGEPASSKDRVLLSLVPHLVLDGLQLACRAVGATEAYVYVHDGPLVAMIGSMVSMRAAAGIDPVTPKVVSAPARFISGQESAVVSRLGGGRALPLAVPPPVYRKGVHGGPTLVQNVETLAHLALIASRGASWFRSTGTLDEPGTMLCTVSGAVPQPGVVETAIGTNIGDLLDRAGGPLSPLQAVLVGGYHGVWLPASLAVDLPISLEGLRSHGATPGAGVVAALPTRACGLVETARVVTYLAAQSARQCGPCLNGLPAMAEALGRLAGRDRSPELPERMRQLASLVERRGACHHPDGTVRFVRSAMTVFAGEIDAHLGGTCTASDPNPVLPTSTPKAAAT
jgi:NADH:ubiquinone oxidoreductase subunit F (NADH-binding)